jgi:hypothetical protein
MPNFTEAILNGLERRRLRLARENAFLDAAGVTNRKLLKAFGLWCWRLRIPMVWFDCAKPRARYLQLHVDMLTTPNALTVAGQQALKELGAAKVSAHDAMWDRVPRRDRDRLGGAVFRALVKPEHYRRAREISPRKLHVLPKPARPRKAAGM